MRSKKALKNPSTNTGTLSSWKLYLPLMIALVGLVTPIGADYAETKQNYTINSSDNLLFLTTRGGPDSYSSALSRNGRLAIVNGTSKETIVEHELYDQYLDIDLIDNRSLFFVSRQVTSDGEITKAVKWDYTEQKELNSFNLSNTVNEIEETDTGLLYADKNGLYHLNTTHNESLAHFEGDRVEDFELINKTIVASLNNPKEILIIEDDENRTYDINHSGRFTFNDSQILIASERGLATYQFQREPNFQRLESFSSITPVDVEILDKQVLVTSEEDNVHLIENRTSIWSKAVPYMTYDIETSDNMNISTNEAVLTDHYWSSRPEEHTNINSFMVNNPIYPAIVVGFLGALFVIFTQRFL